MFTNEAAAYSGENQSAGAAPEVSGTAGTQTDAGAVAGAASSIGQSAEKKSGAQLLREAFSGSASNGADAQTGEVAAASDADSSDAQNDAAAVQGTGSETVGTAVEAPSGTADAKKQTKEENAAFAAARRRAEADYAKKLEGERASVNALISGLGLVDPVTGNAIADVEGLRAFQKMRTENRVTDAAKRAGMSEEELRALIDSHPDVAAAKAERAATVEANAKAQLAAGIAQIGKINNGIKSFEDLLALDRYEEIYGYVQNNRLSLVDAYKLAYMDELAGKREARSAAAARAQVLSKGHLSPAHGVSDGGAEVTPAEIAEMRKWSSFSKMSDGEIATVIRRTKGQR